MGEVLCVCEAGGAWPGQGGGCGRCVRNNGTLTSKPSGNACEFKVCERKIQFISEASLSCSSTSYPNTKHVAHFKNRRAGLGCVTRRPTDVLRVGAHRRVVRRPPQVLQRGVQ